VKRKHTAADYFNLGIGIVVLAVLLGLGIYLLAKGISDHKTGEIIGGAFLAVIGGIVPACLIVLGLQKAARSSVPGLAPPTITLTLASGQFSPGDQVAGRVDVTESGRVRKLEVLLRCHDSTPSYKGISWSTASSPLATGSVAAPASYSFSVALPADAPPTFSNGGASIWWDVDARCDVVGSDVHVAHQIEVAAPVHR
jgi:hypothetical protein